MRLWTFKTDGVGRKSTGGGCDIFFLPLLFFFAADDGVLGAMIKKLTLSVQSCYADQTSCCIVVVASDAIDDAAIEQ